MGIRNCIYQFTSFSPGDKNICFSVTSQETTSAWRFHINDRNDRALLLLNRIPKFVC